MKEITRKDVLEMIKARKTYMDACNKFENDFGVRLIKLEDEIHVSHGIKKMAPFATVASYSKRDSVYANELRLTFKDAEFFQIEKTKEELEL